MELKGIDEIIDVLDAYLERFDLTAELGTAFCVYPELGIIQFSIVEDPVSDACFQDFCSKLNPYVHSNGFMNSLFHEIGHVMTLDDFSQTRLAASNAVKAAANVFYKVNPRFFNKVYFNLPEERAATEWGLNYIETHSDEVRELWYKLRAAFERCYRLNYVEE